MHTKKRSAFTLVELLVSMAIIAVLIGMSIFGIAIAQRVLRDNQRRAAVQDVVAALNAYYSSNSRYPSSISVSANQVVVGTSTVELEGPTAAVSVGSETDASGTLYCYDLAEDGYLIGAWLEDGTVFDDLSSGTVGQCEDSPVGP